MVRGLNLVLITLACCIPVLGGQSATKPDPLERLRYFVGSWQGQQSGQPGQGHSERTYEFVLGGKFLQVRNKSIYPPQEKNKSGETHQDLGIISYDRARERFVLRQFHVEGFVNTYVEQEGSDPKKLVFESEAIENIPPGWRARETYTFLNENEFIERFELAEPGKDFELYSEAHLKRVH